MTEISENPIPARDSSFAVFIAVTGWIVPGMGHLLLRRWGRAGVCFAAVAGLAITGYLLRGNVFQYQPSDAFSTLGYLADLSSGIFYFLAHVFEQAGSDVSRAAGDYGTRFIAAAGVTNLLAILDAFEIAMGGKE